MADLSQNSQDPRPERYLRFPMAVRLSHWVAAAAIFTLLWSGFWIFNLHPRLYWGDVGYFGSPAIAELQADMSGETTSMAIRVGSLSMDVTGLIGKVNVLPFVRVMNFPEGFQFGGTRALHFTAAWVLVICWMLYVYHLVSSGRLKTNWLPRASELTPRHLAYEIVNHLKLRRTRGEAIKKYNVLQKLAYLSVMFGLLPLLLLTGLTMSNSVTTAWPFLFDIFGGRQSARTLHFVFASLMSLFILIHLFELLVAGFFNHTRSMITGHFKIAPEKD
jgi:thiosulfate reductase cytochrome b subunit